MGEKLRSGEERKEEALARAGRFKTVRENLEVKETVGGDGENRVRFVLGRNPVRAERDRQEREAILARVKEELRRIGDLKSPTPRPAARSSLTPPWAATSRPTGRVSLG